MSVRAHLLGLLQGHHPRRRHRRFGVEVLRFGLDMRMLLQSNRMGPGIMDAVSRLSNSGAGPSDVDELLAVVKAD